MPALPILKLPIIVLMKILRTIDIDTVFLISLCSRKMYHLFKNFRDKSVTLRIKIYGESSSVRVVTPNNYYHEVGVISREKEKSGNLERVNISGHLVPIDRSRKHRVWETYWDDKVEGFKSVMEYLLDLFGLKKVTTIIVSPDTMRFLNVLKERQGNDYELYLSHRLKLLLSRNRFTGTEIKRLLQHWAIGGFRRLKYFQLDVEDLNIEDVFRELTHTRMTEKREYKSNAVSPTTFSDRDRLITRNDDVVASFKYDQQYGRVEFGVWPDSEGNQY
ncbi:hypothetical protein CRE_20503 [Caenorhabditis remanei]|uniref:F-box domain-containing protein n=1 Tax=Caenorhabditis remanei TaxID=31234 RepID=E3N8A7_CAERE|nr:hypothetical protein CRE_20503 [Caenorhabditis remanei]